VLLSDGGHQGGEDALRDVARSAADAGVTVHAVLVGLPSGGMVPTSDSDRTPLLDTKGRPVRSVARRMPLEILTDATGGRLIDAAEEPFPATALAGLGFANVGPSSESTVVRKVPVDRYRWFLLAAAGIAAIGRILRGRRDGPLLLRRSRGLTPRRGVSRKAPRVAAVVAFSLVAAGGAEEPSERSVAALEDVLHEHPDDLLARYHLGVAKARAGDLEGAVAAFGEASRGLDRANPDRISGLVRGGERRLSTRLSYGRGVTLARLAEAAPAGARARLLRASREDLLSTLQRLGSGSGEEAISPRDHDLWADAAWNLEVVTRRLLEEGAKGHDADDGTTEAVGADDSSSPEPTPGRDDPAQDPDPDGDRNGAPGSESDEATPPDAGEGDPAGRADGAVGVGDPKPLGPAADRSRNIAEIIARFDRERRAYDLRSARTSRAEAENDW